jgi:hypothetical protein
MLLSGDGVASVVIGQGGHGLNPLVDSLIVQDGEALETSPLCRLTDCHKGGGDAIPLANLISVDKPQIPLAVAGSGGT